MPNVRRVMHEHEQHDAAEYARNLTDVSKVPAVSLFRLEDCTDDSSSTVLREVSTLLPDYAASHPGRR